MEWGGKPLFKLRQIQACGIDRGGIQRWDGTLEKEKEEDEERGDRAVFAQPKSLKTRP